MSAQPSVMQSVPMLVALRLGGAGCSSCRGIGGGWWFITAVVISLFIMVALEHLSVAVDVDLATRFVTARMKLGEAREIVAPQVSIVPIVGGHST